MIEKVIRIAKEAGKILLSYYQKNLNITDKGVEGQDPVTEADMASHHFITTRLQEEFPEDQILSEESSDTKIDFSGRVWIIDPLDGTKQFINHHDTFSVVMGLCVDGIPTVGVVFIPTRNILYFAEVGKGAYLLKEEVKNKLTVSKTERLSEAILFIKSPSKRFRPLDQSILKLSTKTKILGGSFAMKLGEIAEGKADLYVHPSQKLGKWDTGGSQIILTEAGGKITDINGATLNYKQESNFWENSVVASNKIIHEEVISKLKQNFLEIKK